MYSSLENRLDKNRISIKDVGYFAAVILALLFVLWRLPQGYARSDESYYIAMAWRLVRGDVMIIHERNVAQFFALLLCPFVKAYTAVTGGTEGIILAGRYLYLAIVLVFCLCLYIRFRKSYPPAAGALSVMLLLYVPNQIMAASYYTLALLSTTAVCLLSSKPHNNKKLNYYLIGIFYAVMVVCNPLMILLIPAVGVIRIINVIRKKEKIINAHELFIFWGIITLALPYIIYLLSNATLKELVDGLISAMSIRTEVTSDNLLKDRWQELYNRFMDYRSVRAMFIYTIGILCVISIDKNRKKRKAVYAGVSFAILGFFCYWLNIGCLFINYTILSVALSGIIAYSLLDNKNKKAAFFYVLCCSIWFLTLAYSSDQGFLTCACTFFPIAAGGLFAICDLVGEIKEDGISGKYMMIAVRLAAVVLFAAFLSTCVYDKIRCAYQDDSPLTFDSVITGGPMKGIVTNRAHVEEYNAFLEETKEIREHKTGRVHYQTAACWLWLCDEKMPGSMSIWWRDNLSSSKEYYEKNPDFLPECVFIQDNWGTPEQIAPGMGETVEDFEKTGLGYIYIKR